MSDYIQLSHLDNLSANPDDPADEFFDYASYYGTSQPALGEHNSDPMVLIGPGEQLTPPFEASLLPDIPAVPIEQLAKNQIAHHPIRGHWPFRCTECGTVIWRSAELMREHARHNRFKCSCGKTFSRSDALTRHCRQGQKSFHCPKRRCNGAFSRNDHLIQHLRTYHALDEKEIKEIYPNFGGNENVVELACPYVGCEFSRYSQLRFTPWLVELTAPFTKRSDYSRHLKLVHNESPFPCLVNGCERNGGKGYMRKKDLMKHVAKQHPNAPSSSPTALQETS